MAGFNSVADLKPFKTMWRVKVSIVRLWKQYSAAGGLTIEMVIIDSNGDKIHATVKKELVNQFDHQLEQGKTLTLTNFSLNHSVGSYRTTNHLYKISLLATTRVRSCEALPVGLNGFTPVNFQEVLDGSLNPDFLIGKDTIHSGNTIQATLVRDLEASADMPLEEGHSYEIKDFELSHVIPERVRLTRNRYNINITKSSVILKIDPIKHFSFYCFPNWDDLYRGLHHPKFPIDIYGQVIGVGFLEEYIMEPVNGNNGIIDHKIRFFVLHIPNVVIKCVAYGALAHVFNDLWNSIDADIILCVLQCWQINWGQGRLKRVTNIDGISKIVFDPIGVPEIDALRLRIANEDF